MSMRDVVVVGAGPVGLALAIELGSRGVEVEVLDEGDGSVEFPAGEAIFSRTMEHLRRWGIADETRAQGEPPIDYPHRIVFMTKVTGHLLTSFEHGASNGDPGEYAAYTPEGPAFLSKFSLLPALQRAAAELPTVRISYRTRVTGLSQGADRVEAEVEDVVSGARRRVDGVYLAGCDGGRSTVRRALGIGFVGDFAQGRNFAVHFRAPELRGLLLEHARGLAAQIQTLASACRPYITVVNGVDEWRLSVYVNGDPTVQDAVRWVREAVGRPIDVEILRAQPWSGHRVVAERYRSGRVFLVGDAAHLLWPKGGFGANTGIGDAVDLGWKLAAVLRGWGGPALLDIYEAERRPIAQRNVKEASSNWTSDGQLVPDPVLDRDDELGTAARRAMGQLIRDLRGREFRSIGVQLGYRYARSPVIVPDNSPEPPDEPDHYTPTTWPGSRAPHVWLADGSSLLDHFGQGFTLVDTEAGASEVAGELAAAAAARSLPLQVLRLDSSEVARLYPTRLTLVRPDGHVAWRGAELPAEPDVLLDQVRGAAVNAEHAATPATAGR